MPQEIEEAAAGGRRRAPRLRGGVRRRRARALGTESAGGRRRDARHRRRRARAARRRGDRARGRGGRRCRRTRSCSSPPGGVLKTSSGKVRRAATRELVRRRRARRRAAHDARARRRGSSPAAAAEGAAAGRAPGAARRSTRPGSRFALPALVAAGVARSSWSCRAGASRFAWLARAARAVLRARRLPPRGDGPRAAAAPGALVLAWNHASYVDVAALLALLPDRLAVRRQARGARLPRDRRASCGAAATSPSTAGTRSRASPTPTQVDRALARGRSACSSSPKARSSAATGLRPFRLGAFRAAARPASPSCRSRCAGRAASCAATSRCRGRARLALGRRADRAAGTEMADARARCATASPTRSPPSAASRGSTWWPAGPLRPDGGRSRRDVTPAGAAVERRERSARRRRRRAGTSRRDAAAPSLAAPGPSELLLKLECWQPTGSFKVRGATHLLASLSAGRAARAASSRPRRATTRSASRSRRRGSAASRRRCSSRRTAPRAKVDKLRRFPVEVREPGEPTTTRSRRRSVRAARRAPSSSTPSRTCARPPARARSRSSCSSSAPDAAAVLVPVGGGGLVAGIATGREGACAAHADRRGPAGGLAGARASRCASAARCSPIPPGPRSPTASPAASARSRSTTATWSTTSSTCTEPEIEDAIVALARRRPGRGGGVGRGRASPRCAPGAWRRRRTGRWWPS